MRTNIQEITAELAELSRNFNPADFEEISPENVDLAEREDLLERIAKRKRTPPEELKETIRELTELSLQYSETR